MAELREEDWEVLLDSIGQGNCVVLLGSDLAVAGGGERNLVAELARKLSQRLEEDYGRTVPDPEHLAQVAQHYVLETGTPDYAQSAAAKFFEEEVEPADDDPVFEALAALPVSLYVTSRHDYVLDRFLEKRQRPPCTERYHFRGDNPRSIGLGTAERPLVYRLFGWTRERSSMVLTENDLLDFLVAVVSKEPRIPDNLQNELADPDNSFLFLGFGLRYWYLRILLHIFRMSGSRRRSFALEPGLADDRSTVLFYRLGYRAIKLVDTDPGRFVRELGKRWQPLAQRRQASPAEPRQPTAGPGPDAPTVFVSYVEEDREAARRLFDALRGRGLAPWLDEEDLRVGERWDPRLEQAIADCDYFVVLQSRHLDERDVSYVYKEVEIALEKQSRQRPGLVFILPVRIDDVTYRDGSPGCLESLRHLQTQDLLDEDGVGRLLRQIVRDHQVRTKKV